jgi:hypothetical protein
MQSPRTLTGGCLCATRYEIDDVNGFQAICHCRMCQRASGGALTGLRTPMVNEEDGSENRCQPDKHQSKPDQLISAAALGSKQANRIIGLGPSSPACRARLLRLLLRNEETGRSGCSSHDAIPSALVPTPARFFPGDAGAPPLSKRSANLSGRLRRVRRPRPSFMFARPPQRLILVVHPHYRWRAYRRAAAPLPSSWALGALAVGVAR